MQNKEETPVWFAMRATYRRELKVKAQLEEIGMTTFIPMRYSVSGRGRQKKRELVPVIHNLIFVYAVPSQLQQVKISMPYLQYIIDTRSRQKIVVPDVQMRRFIEVAGTYDDHLLYFQPEELNLAKGTKVRIIGGQFEGYEGVFVKVKGARDKRVVVQIQGVIAMAMATVNPDFIEPIE